MLQTAVGPGAAKVPGAHAATLEALIEPWQRERAALPVVLCGMVGSSLGWVTVPYLPTPARPEQIAAGCLGQWNGRVQIVPGLSCRNCFGAPDLMRGEETQILGAMRLAPQLRQGRRLLCLPGTHTKWVVLVDGEVREFLTAPVGELHALLCAHSVLVGEAQTPERAAGDEAYAKGLQVVNEHPQAQLVQLLFECRSRRLSGELTDGMPAAFLSGMLIASDVGGALVSLGVSAENPQVTLIGAPALTAFYQIALEHRRTRSQCVDGAAASLAGLIQVHRQLSTGV